MAQFLKYRLIASSEGPSVTPQLTRYDSTTTGGPCQILAAGYDKNVVISTWICSVVLADRPTKVRPAA